MSLRLTHALPASGDAGPVAHIRLPLAEVRLFARIPSDGVASCEASQSAYHTGLDLEFPAVFRQVPEGYIAFVEEFPGANTQGATLEEARANLQEAVSLVLEANRTLAQEAVSGQDVIREALKVGA